MYGKIPSTTSFEKLMESSQITSDAGEKNVSKVGGLMDDCEVILLGQ